MFSSSMCYIFPFSFLSARRKRSCFCGPCVCATQCRSRRMERRKLLGTKLMVLMGCSPSQRKKGASSHLLQMRLHWSKEPWGGTMICISYFLLCSIMVGALELTDVTFALFRYGFTFLGLESKNMKIKNRQNDVEEWVMVLDVKHHIIANMLLQYLHPWMFINLEWYIIGCMEVLNISIYYLTFQI